MVAENVALVAGDKPTSFTGVAYCGSVWACPVDSAVIRQERAREIEVGASRWARDHGGTLAFTTATLRHSRGDSLDVTLALLLEGWAWIKRQRAVKEALGRLGYAGSIKAVEITVDPTRSGWHPHLHLLLLLGPQAGPDALADLEGLLHAWWVKWFAREGWPLPAEGIGMRVQPATARHAGMAWYLSKVQDDAGRPANVGMEMARGDAKRGRKTSLSPFELLARHRARRLAGDTAGARRDRKLWQDYERVTCGRRAIVWSPGLKDLLGVRDVTDEQILDEALHSEGMTARLLLNRWEWLAVCRTSSRHLVIETYDTAGLRAAQALIAVLLQEDRDASAGISSDHGPRWEDIAIEAIWESDEEPF